MTPAKVRPLPASPGELLLRQSPGCAWLVDRDGTFHEVFGDTVAVFGRAPETLHLDNFLELCEPPARHSWSARLQRVFAGDTVFATGHFGGAPPGCSVMVFPVRSPDGEVVIAGGMAHEVPEAAMLLRTLDALEDDRARLSRLLHDRIGQGLSAAGLQLDLLRMDLADSALAVPPRIGEIQAVLESIMGLVREVNRELNPAVAERVGLRAALDRLAGELRQNFKGNVRVFADATAQPPPEVAAALYRIAQEASTHAARRAGCSVIEILLKSLRSGLTLEIRDNSPMLAHAIGALRMGGVELLVMQHLADRAGAELQIEMTPETGSVIRVLYRHAERAAAADSSMSE